MDFQDKKKIEEVFQKALVIGRPSESTLLKYQALIMRFFTVMNIEKISDLTMENFEKFTTKMRSRGMTNSYIGNAIAAMKWFLARYKENPYRLQEVKKIVIDKIVKPPIEHHEVVYLSKDEIRRFIECIKVDFSKGLSIRKERFLGLISLLIQTGARIGEALSINISDIDRQALEIPILGKGKKERTLIINKEVLQQLDKYLSMRKNNHEALFTSLYTESRWQQTDVNRTFIRYRMQSGITKKFTNHTIRHTFATHLLINGVPINAVQYLLGHSKPEITLKFYIGAIEKDMAKEAVKDKFFNLSL